MSNNRISKIASILFALLVWQLAAVIVGYDYLLASPLKTVKDLVAIAITKQFWATTAFSFFRISAGFLLAFILGFLTALLAGRFSLLETFLRPFMLTIKSVPVASFIILALFWLKSGQLPTFVAFLIVLPIVYTNILKGYKETDANLLKVASVCGADWLMKLRVAYLPESEPYITSAISVGSGTAFKSGVAAEVIVLISGSIGEQLYMSKVHFEMDALLAWTVIIILLSFIFEKLFSVLCLELLHRLEQI